MNKNVLIVLVGAVVVAVLVAVLVQVSLGGGNDAGDMQPAEKIQILVASKDLKIGSELGSSDMEWQDWPKSSRFPGAVVRMDDQDAVDAVKGRLARNIAEGEPVVKSALIAEDKGNFVAASLAPGMRAVAIEVKASSMVAGFIGPGDFVDVILTYKETIRTDDENPQVQAMFKLNLDRLATETIIQNVAVVAVDQSAVREDEEEVKIGKTVTLAVSVKDMERLTLAQEMGELHLALRGVGDDVVFTKEWPTVSDARLTNMGDEIFAEYERMKKDSNVSNTIMRVYNGDQVQSVQTR